MSVQQWQQAHITATMDLSARKRVEAKDLQLSQVETWSRHRYGYPQDMRAYLELASRPFEQAAKTFTMELGSARMDLWDM